MTISYNQDLSKTSTTFENFVKLQLRWRGSIWKSVMKELFIFSIAFGCITVIYRTEHVLDKENRQFWDNFAELFDQKLNYIPLTFMLGFFVTIIVNRWNDIFLNIGWVDNTALLIATYIRGSDEKSRILRRTVLRYMVLTQAIIFRDISMQVKRRFMHLETMVAAGLMLESEREKFSDLNIKHKKYFLPIQWCFSLLYEARAQGKIGADVMLNELIKSVADFRRGLGQLCNYDWVPIPLVYPQVVFLAVRIYFFLCLIGRQSVLIDGEPPKGTYQFMFPIVPYIMTSLQFMFYVGWMKVAESLMNPLGEDDDDFECNYLIDRNLAIGLAIVDDCYNDAPPLQKDAFWSAEVVEPLYSSDTAGIIMNPQVGSAANFENDENEIVMVRHNDVIEEYDDDIDPENLAAPRVLPRVVSVVSVNRNCESRSSITSRNRNGGILDRLKSLGGGSRKINRPGRLFGSSTCSINTITAGSSQSILEDLADEASKNALLTPDDFAGSPRRTPIDVLTSVPEEDEEAQKTRTSVDFRKWKDQIAKTSRTEEKKDEEKDQQ